MIESLIIQNIQSHAKTELDLHPGVNVIVGYTDSGKTAIIRSIKLLVWNRPSGNRIRSRWGGNSFVRLTTKEGSVTRIKGTSEKYKLSIIGQKPIIFEAFGTSVPEEVSNFLNIDNINFQEQLDSHFLLSKTAGEVAKFFNKIAKFDKIDIGIAYIKKEITKLTSNIVYNTDQEKIYIEELKGYEYLEEAEAQLEVLEDMEKRYDRIWHKRSKLGGILLDYNTIIEDIKIESTILEIEKPLDEILTNIEKKKSLEEKRNKLIKLVYHLRKINNKIKEQNQIILIEPKLNTLLGYYKERNTVQLQHDSLFKVVKNLSKIKIELKSAEETYYALLENYNNEFPDICPLCGSKIPHDHNLKYK